MSGRLRTALAVVLGAGGLVLAHLEVLARGPSYAGPLLVLDHAFDLLLAAGLLAVVTAAGRAALRRTGLDPGDPLESLLASAAVGAGVLAAVFLGLGAVGLLGPVWLAAVVAGAAFAARRELAELPAWLGRCTSHVKDRLRDPWLPALAGVVTLGAALFLLLHGSAPPGDWDSLMYHLEVPRRWLAEGRIYLLEDSFHTGLIGPIQLLYLPFLAVGSPAAAALLNGLFALLLAAAVFSVAERLFGSGAAVLSVAVLWASTGLLLVAGTARVDTTLAFYLLLAHWYLVRAVVDEESRASMLLLAAVLLGLATGVKLHGFAYAAALAPVGLWAVWRAGSTGGERARLAGIATGVFGLAALPWLVSRTALLGSPFFPIFAEPMLPTWLAGLYGSTGLPPGVDPGDLRLLSQAREPFDLVSLFTAQEALTVEPEGVHYHTNPLLLLLPLWLLHLRKARVAALAVPALLYGALVVVPFETTNLRYLFSAIPPLTVVTAFFLVEGVGRLERPVLRRVVLSVAAVAVLLPTVRSAVSWTKMGPVVGQLAGTVSGEAYVMERYRFYGGVVAAVNRTVPEDGRVLMLWESRGFYLAPDHLQDNVLRNWPLLLPHLERSGGCLEDTGITHILVSTAAVRYYAGRGLDVDRLRWDRFEPFRERCLRPATRGGGFVLYRLAPAGAAGG